MNHGPGARPPVRLVASGELVISDRDEILGAYSLGSCVALALYDPDVRLGGLLHAMLPVSTICPEKAAASPGMFTDTGVVALLQGLLDRGARKRQLRAWVAGAAAVSSPCDSFNIGKRNYAVVRKLLWRNRILITAEAVGGDISRTLFLNLREGRVILRSQGQDLELR
jgi:chemotaxis protein CheD